MCVGFAAVYRGRTVLCCMECRIYTDIFTGKRLVDRAGICLYGTVIRREYGETGPDGVSHEGLLPMTILSGQLSA